MKTISNFLAKIKKPLEFLYKNAGDTEPSTQKIFYVISQACASAAGIACCLALLGEIAKFSDAAAEPSLKAIGALAGIVFAWGMQNYYAYFQRKKLVNGNGNGGVK